MGGSGTGLEKSSILTTDLIWQPDPGGVWHKKTVAMLSEQATISSYSNCVM